MRVSNCETLRDKKADLLIFIFFVLDLKAFERRLTEVLACLQPNCLRWRIVLCIVTLIAGISAFFWLRDPQVNTVLSFVTAQK